MTFWTQFLKEVSKPLGFGIAFGLSVVAVLSLIYFYSEHRVVVYLGQLACPSCGQLFGFTAARDARCRYRNECSEISRKHGSGAFVDFDHRWEVECSHCHQTAVFDSLARRLENAA
jgi:hypothetical protein